MDYKKLKDLDDIVRTDSIHKIEDDGTIRSVPNDVNNVDWQAYQAWIDLGNTPQAAD